MGRNKHIFFLVFLAVLMAGPYVLAENVKAPAKEESFDKNELMDLVAEDNLAIDPVVIDTPWGDRNPFDADTFKVLTAPPPPPVFDLKAAVKGDFILSGIIWSGSQPSAIINDEVIGVGDKIKNLTVKEIKEGTVTLSDGKNEMTLSPIDTE
ncbi:MAG: hypothetical protein HQL17_03740 [Candidatus Omnitrophica bacterium]|nr:hypothetical protein [Candidatus Omnitrophota bacterium]